MTTHSRVAVFHALRSSLPQQVQEAIIAQGEREGRPVDSIIAEVFMRGWEQRLARFCGHCGHKIGE